MTIVTLFLLLNPAAVVAIWLGHERQLTWRQAAIGATTGFLGLGLAVLATRPLLDALDTSDPTFRIAAGVLVIFGALQAFLSVGLRHRLESPGWLTAALVLWLASPAALAAAMAVRINEGIAIGLLVAAAAVAVAVLLGLLWLRQVGDRHTVLLGWIRRVIAALAAAGGIELIRQGVLTI